MIVVEGEGEVVVVFPTLLPKRGMLEVVWRGARGCLWEPTTEKERDNEGGKGMVDLSI
jgi:phosphatidylinositol glycan class H protein